MPCRIEDYAFLSDLESAALVGIDGSIDWLTFPRFDSPSCFSALLGEPEHGRWLLAPAGGQRSVARHYRGASLVLETVYTTDDGEVAVIDCMPPRDDHLEVIRIVEGRRGRVPMHTELIIRFDYGWIVPWVRNADGGLFAVGGPDALRLQTPVPVEGKNLTTVATFEVGEGDRLPFRLTWSPSHRVAEPATDPLEAVAAAERWWHAWAAQGTYEGKWADDVCSSLVVLKGLTYGPTGGICAAATTSLPEKLGGERNWDYRHCWLRDATFSLLALLSAGYNDEAMAWRDWLLRAVAGDPAKLQIMYGLAGERRIPERTLDWLPGYEGSRPVRIGNDASKQFQLDVYGEVMDAAYQAHLADIGVDGPVWQLQEMLVDFVESAWPRPDEGIWEVRSDRKHFTHSKVMAWVAIDRAIRTAERSNVPTPLEPWRQLREEIKQWVLEHCVDERGRLVQHPGTTHLDASLLTVPLVGFLPPDDERVIATVDGIDEELGVEGFVQRYISRSELDGLPAGEGSFLMCSFWMAQAKAVIGRHDEARTMFERLLAVRNDVGLLSEQYDPVAGRMLGNIPQAFSHTALVNTAVTLNDARAAERAGSAPAAANPRQPR
jgi:GH15 family glucan-1,4-alpha-glucosidase